MQKTLYHFTLRLDAYLRLMRLDRPIGTLLLLWPTLTAVLIASHGAPDAKTLFIFLLGTFVMRAAGCVVNDFFDRNLDHKVTRTWQRPLALKQITVFEAILIAIILFAIALVLVLNLNHYSLVAAIIAAALTLLYPLCKRFTHYPQIVLGVAFNFGVIIAFTAISHHIPFTASLLFIASICWTVAYDTMYAMVDRDDDKRVGLKSIAIALGDLDKMGIAIFQIATLVILLLIGTINHFNGWYYIGMGGAALFMLYQQLLIRERGEQACFKAFLNNNWAWLMVFLGVLLCTR